MSKKDLERNLAEIENSERLKILQSMRNAYIKMGVPQVDPQEYDQEDYSSPTYVKMNLNLAQASQIFLDHRYMPRKLLAEKYGAELVFFHEKKKPINIIQRIYQDVIKKPERYSEYLTQEDIDQINRAVVARSGFNEGLTPETYGAAKSVRAIIANPIADYIEKMEGMVNKSANIMELKLDSYKNKKDVKSLDIKKAVEVLKIMTDLKRLEKGEATEHIAHYVKAEKLNDMDSSELINLMNAQRAAETENNS